MQSAARGCRVPQPISQAPALSDDTKTETLTKLTSYAPIPKAFIIYMNTLLNKRCRKYIHSSDFYLIKPQKLCAHQAKTNGCKSTSAFYEME